METLRESERPEAELGRPTVWVASYLALTVLGCVQTVRWLFLSDRGWSSTTAYFDPWHKGVVPLALILSGYALLSVVKRRGVSIPDWMVTAARYASIVVLAVVVVIVLLVPFVLWFLGAVVVPIVLALLWVNRRRIERGRLPRIPRTTSGWISVAETAAQIRPHT